MNIRPVQLSAADGYAADKAKRLDNRTLTAVLASPRASRLGYVHRARAGVLHGLPDAFGLATPATSPAGVGG